jgi:hypothetical protein
VNVKFDGAFRLSKPGSIENAQTEFDCRGVPGTQLVADADGIAPFQPSGLLEEGIEQLHIHLPRSLFIRVGKRGPMNL